MTLDSTSMSNDTHDFCWMMLPWFVTGRLAASDIQRIERHLEQCASCRAELAEQRELCLHIRRDEPLMLAPQASLQKMLARIDANVGSVELDHVAPNDVAAPAVHTKPKSYRWLALAAAVQTIAIAFLLTSNLTSPRYTTYADSTPSDHVAVGGAVLRVVFKPEGSVGQVQSLLNSVSAQVIAGPTEAGVYTLRLQHDLEQADIARALSQVRADGSVMFAEQVAGEHTP